MPPATKFAPSPVPLEGPQPVIDLDTHQADMARRQAERDAKRAELRKCFNPAYSTKLEMAKPVYQWTVSAQWLGVDDKKPANLQAEQVVTAQNESDAWAAFCDKIGFWPSRRDCQPVITRGKKIDADTVAATRMFLDDSDTELPTVVVGAVSKKKKR